MADALADGKAIKKSSKEKVPYYEVTRGKRDIVIVPAVGHLYGLEEKEKKLNNENKNFIFRDNKEINSL